MIFQNNRIALQIPH